jgi:spoIIIJ-associated protein
VTEPVRVEATGETVSEAKWSALRALELRAPTLDRAEVSFEVLSEGSRGLLGLGAEPARVAASVEAVEAAPADHGGESDDARRVRVLLEHVTATLDVPCRIEIAETDDSVTATCVGDDLGRLIGRHGQRLDAVQLLARTILRHGAEPHRDVVIDAAGYRDRRRQRLEEIASRGADEALGSGARVELEPMSAAERKLVHTYLEHHPGVTTASEGDEPYRRVVVVPA